jgi:alpha-glucosidase
MKVIIDIVPNHTSNRHAWFREALAAGKGSPARDRYIFRDGLGEHGAWPPAEWVSVFGGPAWTRVPDGQWYLHLFTVEQPDLNWANREVRDDFLDTLRFWSDRGVDGFRVDVAHGLAKNLAEPLAPVLPGPEALADGSVPAGTHPLWDRDEVHEIYAEWRQVFDSYDPPRAAVAEAWVHPTRRPRYASPDGLGQAFNFDLLAADWNAGEFLRIITDNLSDAQRQGSSTTWVLSNHDVVRHATRYGLPPEQYRDALTARTWLLSGGTAPGLDRGLGLRRARAAILLMLALPGSVYLYQGEELGLGEVPDIPAEQVQDPVFTRTRGADKGRDGCRVPLPWTAEGPSFGFGPGPAHLPQPAWFGPLSAELQERDPDSTLLLYRRALSWRRKLLQASENMEWMPGTGGQVLHLARPGGWRSVTNFGPGPVPLRAGTVIVSSAPVDGNELPADTTAWILAPASR